MMFALNQEAVYPHNYATYSDEGNDRPPSPTTVMTMYSV